MAQAMAMYPMMQDAMKRMQNESKNMKGTPLATEMRFNIVAGAEQQAQAAETSKSEEKSAPRPASAACSAASARRWRRRTTSRRLPRRPGGSPS